MNRHAGPPAGATTPAVPEPSYAERARTLAHLGRTGTLATLSRKHPGHPFASVMPYALDERGRPLMLISSMAMHTQNLMTDARASLLNHPHGAVEQPGSLSGFTEHVGENVQRVHSHQRGPLGIELAVHDSNLFLTKAVIDLAMEIVLPPQPPNS